MREPVRRARTADLAGLPEIERSADGMFASVGIVLPAGPTMIEEVGERARVWVAGDPPVGFAAVVDVDGRPHLEQIAVRADRAGRGVGGRLLARVIEESRGGLTLITFRDVPWNAPWYARFGFTALPEREWGPRLRERWEAEIAAGLHALGPRVVMRRG
ncbi:GNAT family N-acetyltransferase [Thermomonospora catenispora]|uniref:GNAT family N-acetyltransferase n=1 Tax=Thermomonospora catenispora TaxID=2493090 RepID=UPI00111FD8D0|nr:GNAT family N-acetyltransferase [Thermomonospora catenispora]TNY37642.1 N-acetyltransferase [Thermomonospora catenispora]